MIVASDSIAEAGSVHTNESTYRSDQSPLDRVHLYSWDLKDRLASVTVLEEGMEQARRSFRRSRNFGYLLGFLGEGASRDSGVVDDHICSETVQDRTKVTMTD